MRRILFIAIVIASCKGTTNSSTKGDDVVVSPGTDVPEAAGATPNIWDCPATGDAPGFSLYSDILNLVRGKLSGPSSLIFNCKKVALAATTGEQSAWQCKVVPGQETAPQYTVDPVIRADGKPGVNIKSPDGKAWSVACTNNDVRPASVPKFEDIQTIVDNKCASCHVGGDDGQNPPLKTLADFRAVGRNVLLDIVQSGFMPYRQSTWRSTPDGQKMITWLKWSEELNP